MSEASKLSYDKQFEAIKPDIDEAFHRHVTKAGRTTISLDPYDLVPLDSYLALRAEYEDHIKIWVNQGLDIESIIKATYKVDAATE